MTIRRQLPNLSTIRRKRQEGKIPPAGITGAIGQSASNARNAGYYGLDDKNATKSPSLLHKRNATVETSDPLPVETGREFAFPGFMT
jgi:hypothetical protein